MLPEWFWEHSSRIRRKGSRFMNLDKSVKVGSPECPIRKIWVLESDGMFLSVDRTWVTINNALIFQDSVPALLAGKLILEIPVCRSGRTAVNVHEMYEVRVGDFAILVKQEPTPGFRTFYGVYKSNDRSDMVSPGDLLRLTNWCNKLDGWDEIKESAPVIHLP